jgi:hypothetical protein
LIMLLSINPLSLVKLLLCRCLSVASFSRQSKYPIPLTSIVISLKLILWPIICFVLLPQTSLCSRAKYENRPQDKF